jgi:uncharacterized membrane protein YvbJ
VIVCPTCGHDNAEDAKFCSGCGAKLDAPAAASREIRKTVTVVLCDVWRDGEVAAASR